MEEKPGQPQPQHHHSHHHPHHHPQQQQQQQQSHHHHHYYFYNHSHNHHHHHHHQQPHQYLQHGAEGSPKAQPKPLKHEQKHTLQQHQETPKKKTGYGEINGNAGEISLKSLGSDEATNPISRVLNGNQQVVDTSLKQTVKTSTFGKAGIKTKNFIQKNSMDKKNGKSYENKSGENQAIDKTDIVAIPNGVITNNSGYITNGYMGKGADNDGSGSESGYTTPKKRKARRNSAKGCENLNLVQDKIMQETSVPALKQGLESLKPDYSEQKGTRADGSKPIWKYETGPGGTSRGKPVVGDTLRKSSDIKPGLSSKKFDDRPKGKHASAAASKEDSWTLFKPPPVFPVDNSSAKIVPKISYASKVKENLNKTVQNSSVSPSSSSSSSLSTGETQTQSSSRLSQVPMSALKSVTSANFSNGPVLAGTDGNVYPSGGQSLLTTAANTLTPISTGTDSVLQDMSLTSAAVEQIKSSLFIYPSNMQTVLLSTAQVDLPSQTDQQNLGDIFQNQWGLSFINEPSAGPETVIGKSSDHKVMEVTFQGEYPATLVSQGAEIIPSGTEHPVFPKAYELEKRTSPQVLGNILKPGTTESGALPLEPSHIGDLQKADASSQGALVFLSKDYEIENQNPLASPTNTLLGSAKEQRYQRGLERNDSWGSFDLRAAIVYHTKEMESIWNLQKQDPKRIITYNEAMDSPDQ
ncbi:FMR1-interacting protein NUFIP2 [Phodopus roborovskii]|uniref:FMR1-interacting protein NUFIP2 n=1 Tax=Phodopus roborovskii TaxID=109678 RepID=UPI0021E4E54C|nr:FMR1-interacting protein NUFIP2 [Phodopus roborovskii]